MIMQISSFNVRGIRKTRSVTGLSSADFHRWLRHQTKGIVCLQELQFDPLTPIDPKTIHWLETALGATSAIWTPFCAILLKDTSLSISDHSISPDNRAIFANITSSTSNLSFTITCVYAPANRQDRSTFLNNLLLLPFFISPPPFFVLAGDFNFRHHSRNHHPLFQEWLRQYALDALFDGQKEQPTFTSAAGGHRSTIDYIFLSPTFAALTSNKRSLYPCGFSDHDLLSVDLRPPGGSPHGKGVWQCNKFHIRQPEFAPILTQALDHLFARPFRGTEAEAWERVKKRVKSVCISFSTAAKQREDNALDLLHQRRQDWVHQEALLLGTGNPSLLDIQAEIGLIEQELDQLTGEHLEQLAFRSGLQWIEKGERSTQYFHRAIKQRHQKRTMPKLVRPTEPDTELEGQEMRDYARSYYQELYTPEAHVEAAVAVEQILSPLQHRPRVSAEENSSLLRPVSMDDLLNMMDYTPKGRTPGDDGLPFELYPLLLAHDSTAHLFLSLFNNALLRGEYPPSWYRTVMILLHKKGDPQRLSNWRPLSLINCDAKLFTKVLANRLNGILPRLLTPYQTGFVRGRAIADNGMILSCAMDHCKVVGSGSIGVLLDQEKAYDRVHPIYLEAVLARFGFSALLIRLLTGLFFNTQVHLNVNGHIALPFQQQRGLRQGDPLSPLLFNLAFEPFLQKLLTDDRLPGCRLPDPCATVRLLAYADDLLQFINSAEEWTVLQELLDLYSRASNAKVNLSKTIAFPLSRTPDPELQRLVVASGTKWHDENSPSFEKYLGYPIPVSRKHVDLFFDSLLIKIRTCFQIHSQRNLSILGKGTITNSLALSTLWHVLWVFHPSIGWMAKLRREVTQFMCINKPKPSWFTICTPRLLGGLGVIDPQIQATAFQLKHLRLSLEPSPRIGHVLLLGLLFVYSEMSHPLSALLQSLSRRTIKALNQISSLGLLIKAAKELPRISLEPANGTDLFPPANTLLATPVEWWIRWVNHPPGPRECPMPFRMGEVFFYDNDTRLLGWQASLDNHRGILRVLARWPFRFTPNIYRARSIPVIPNGDDLSQRILDIPLEVGQQGPAGTLGSANAKTIRLFLQSPPTLDRRHGTPAQWARFWKAHIPHNARTIWWRAIQGKIPTGVLKNRIWSRANEDPTSPSCAICHHAQEDLAHFLFLCPSKKDIWTMILAQYSTKTQWSDAELSSLIDLDCNLVRSQPQFTITPIQLVASILLSIWSLHWAFIFDEVPLSTASGLPMARRHIHTLMAQNIYRKGRPKPWESTA